MSGIEQTCGNAHGARWHAMTDVAALRQEACRRILGASGTAIAARGHFVLVLAGGNTPMPIYTALRDAETDWSCWDVWFGDERCLPAGDPERNSTMATQAWLAHVPMPIERIHVIAAELGASGAAVQYSDALRGVGAFDLVLLGLGEDGHTASLFPDHDWGSGVDAPDALAVLDAPKPPPQRVSLSAARLSHARSALFLVAGAGKHEAVRRWRQGDAIPARAIRPRTGVDVLVTADLLGPD